MKSNEVQGVKKVKFSQNRAVFSETRNEAFQEKLL